MDVVDSGNVPACNGRLLRHLPELSALHRDHGGSQDPLLIPSFLLILTILSSQVSVNTALTLFALLPRKPCMTSAIAA